MPKFLPKNFQLSIALLAMFATTSIPLGVLQVGVWANMFENFYQETQSIFLTTAAPAVNLFLNWVLPPKKLFANRTLLLKIIFLIH
jgi:hypothetical protein